jgi:adenylate kinase family enzyme
MLPASSLGTRIAIFGPSNSGKSTLAAALSQQLGIPAVHLDQLKFIPNTNWEMRPNADFAARHENAVKQDSWIIEGNYSRHMSARLERATGAILITSNRYLRLGRYLKRTILNNSARAGHLEGAKDSIKWEMIDWVLFKSPKNVAKYQRMIDTAGITEVTCANTHELNALYAAWDLIHPS